MKALITKTSDWRFRKVINNFVFSEESFKKLTKKYGEYSFVVTFGDSFVPYDITIEIYDDYRE